MLNEKLEAFEYIYDVESMNPGPERIKRPIFLKKNKFKAFQFLGIEHVLTVLARYFVFDDDVEYKDGIRRANAAIHMWCGHTPENTADDELAEQYEYLRENYPWLDTWIHKYLRKAVKNEDEDVKADIEEAIKALIGKKSGFSISSLNKIPKENDYKTVRYDKTIANAAVTRGPLKVYYLACVDPQWSANIRRKGEKKLSSDHEDRVLKTIAAYLIERNLKPRHDDAPRFERINLKDISFWAVMDSNLDSSTHYRDYTVHERKLFEFDRGMSGNMVKTKPDPEWFADCGWELIDATEDDSGLDNYLENNPDGIFFSDAGGCKPLNLNKRYER